MNFLEPYYTEIDGNQVSIDAVQGSAFAKHVADDFNPIHDADSKRFCVPGDLLFAIALNKFGIHQSMEFHFLDMVAANTSLIYPSAVSGEQDFVINKKGKNVLGLSLLGVRSEEDMLIEQLVRNYVAFSGQNFPHILLPLMQEYNVMINPLRPLVIYQSMSLNFDTLDFEELSIALGKTSLAVEGKRGDAKLHFSLTSNGANVGTGVKKLVLSGLRPYDDAAVTDMCERYYESKAKLKS